MILASSSPYSTWNSTRYIFLKNMEFKHLIRGNCTYEIQIKIGTYLIRNDKRRAMPSLSSLKCVSKNDTGNRFPRGDAVLAAIKIK